MTSLYSKLKKQAKDKPKKPEKAEPIEEVKPQVEAVPEEKLLSVVEEAKPIALPKEEPKKVEPPVVPVQLETKHEQIFTAFGCYYNHNDKRFYKVTIDYNPITCETVYRSCESVSDSLPGAIFKINQANGDKLVKRKEIL